MEGWRTALFPFVLCCWPLAALEAQAQIGGTSSQLSGVGAWAPAVPTSAAWEMQELWRWLCAFCGFSVLLLFSLLMLQAAEFKPTLTAASACFVLGSTCKGC